MAYPTYLPDVANIVQDWLTWRIKVHIHSRVENYILVDNHVRINIEIFKK